MFILRRAAILVILGFLMNLPVLGADARGQGYQTAKDWKDIYILPTNGDAARNVKISLSVDKTQVQPGDDITLTFRANQECYLTIMDVGTSGRIIRLWPNKYSGTNNRVSADTPMAFPGQGAQFRYKIAGPEGMERIIAYATTQRGKILSENEFQALRDTGFKQYIGSAKDLVAEVEKNTAGLPPGVHWGTTQVNVRIGSGVTPGAAAPAAGTVYVLALGVPTGNLRYCMRDAQKFVDALIQKMGVRESNVRLVLGSEATRDGLVSGMKWLESNTKPEDSAIVFFSGHGTSVPDQPPTDEKDGRDECFVLYHTSRPSSNQEALRKGILLKDDDFNKLMKTIPARKKLLVVDSCHSGTINKWLGMEAGSLVSKYYPLKDSRTNEEMWNLEAKAVPTNYGNDNEAIMSACLDNETAYENRKAKGGLFIHYLLTAIDSGASDMKEAFEKAKGAVVEACRKARGSGGSSVSQTPNLTDPHGLVKLFKFNR